MIDVVDEKNNISLSEFTRYTDRDILELTKINDNCSIEKYKVEKLEYIKIYNLFLYPEDLKKFLCKFPCEDRFLSLSENGTELTSSAPGFQQTFDKHYFRKISEFISKVMKENNLSQHYWSVPSWEYYSNCMYSGMKSYQRNNFPHVDPFDYACNMYLSRIENTGTTFFSFIGDEHEYYDVKELHRRSKKDHELFLKQVFENSIVTDFVDWKTFDGNSRYRKYHIIDAEYNSASIYKGCYWHSIRFDSEIKNQIRYSLVGSVKK